VRVGGDKQTFSGRSLEFSPSTRNTAQLGQRILSKKKKKKKNLPSTASSLSLAPPRRPPAAALPHAPPQAAGSSRDSWDAAVAAPARQRGEAAQGIDWIGAAVSDSPSRQVHRFLFVIPNRFRSLDINKSTQRARLIWRCRRLRHGRFRNPSPPLSPVPILTLRFCRARELAAPV